jgi:caa(3)-type oxidase subunit IV
MAEHVLPKRVYYTVFGILMLCTYLTVQIAFLDLGAMNTVAALAIAVFKATIVVLFSCGDTARASPGQCHRQRFLAGILLVLTFGGSCARWLHMPGDHRAGWAAGLGQRDGRESGATDQRHSAVHPRATGTSKAAVCISRLDGTPTHPTNSSHARQRQTRRRASIVVNRSSSLVKS